MPGSGSSTPTPAWPACSRSGEPAGIICTGILRRHHGRRPATHAAPGSPWRSGRGPPRACRSSAWCGAATSGAGSSASSNAFLAYGTEAREYLLALGAPAERVLIAWNTVDTGRFERAGHSAHSPDRYEPLRLLTVGYLERRKRVDRAIRAVAAAGARGLDVVLDIAGEGSERASLEAARAGVRRRGAPSVSSATGTTTRCSPPTRAPTPSSSRPARDIWGLVLGGGDGGRACPASPRFRAGATRDLVLEDETGYAVDFDDTDAVVDRLARLRGDPGRIEYMGNEARNRIREHFTLDHSGRGWVKLVREW